VFVYKLIVEDGIEETIEILKARKAAIAEALFAGAAKSALDLSEAEARSPAEPFRGMT
jgi:SNF2 family DNA or RNA helicase